MEKTNFLNTARLNNTYVLQVLHLVSVKAARCTAARQAEQALPARGSLKLHNREVKGADE